MSKGICKWYPLLNWPKNYYRLRSGATQRTTVYDITNIRLARNTLMRQRRFSPYTIRKMKNMTIKMASNHDLVVEMHKKQKKMAFQGALGTFPSVGEVEDINLLVRGKDTKPLVQRNGLGQSLLTSQDRRTEVSNPTAAPWRMICSLLITAADGEEYVGTGWIAGPRLIITAGHCLFEKNWLKGWATKINVYPGRSSTSNGDTFFSSTHFKAPEKWVGECDENFDYGAIILTEDIGLSYGHFSSSTFGDADLMNHMINISGYPATKLGETQLHHENRVNSVSPTKIYYDVDTEGGQSGSPIWIYEEGSNNPVVIGVHSYGAGNAAAGNSGVRITEEIIKFIEKWREN